MIRALFRQWGDRFHRFLDYTAPLDPSWADSEPSRLDRIGGIHTTVRESLTEATTTFGGTDLIAPAVRDRAARHITEAVVTQLRTDLTDDPDLFAQYEARFAGERGDLPAIRGALTGAHERDDAWLTFGRPTSDERYADGRGRDL